MTAQIIWIKEYRDSLSTLRKKAQENNIKYIVMSHNTPIFEVTPIRNTQKKEAKKRFLSHTINLWTNPVLTTNREERYARNS